MSYGQVDESLDLENKFANLNTDEQPTVDLSEDLTIRDVGIKFPFKSYKVQQEYMNHVLKAVMAGQNAMLESPSGTGKTLCLLTSILYWFEDLKRRNEFYEPSTGEPKYRLIYGVRGEKDIAFIQE